VGAYILLDESLGVQESESPVQEPDVGSQS